MRTQSIFKAAVATLIGWMAVVAHAQQISTVPLETYTATSAVDVKPNIMYILDDSGSMMFDYMPDETEPNNSGTSPAFRFRNARFNGMAYNPALVYKPPIAIGSDGVSNTTTYLSMTGTSTSTGGDGTATTASPNWNAVKNDAYGILNGVISGFGYVWNFSEITTSPSYVATTRLTPSTTFYPYFYTTIAGQYCTTPRLLDCQTQSAASDTHPFPAYTRWCNGSTCQATYDSAAGYTTPRAPTPRVATITVGGSTGTNAIVSGITIGAKQIMRAASAGSTGANTVAQNIVNQINLCEFESAGNCQVRGYTAVRTSNVVTIYAPDTTISTPVVTVSSGGFTYAVTSFSQGSVPGENLRTNITSDVNSYSFPGSATKASSRTDCVGTTCTYREEMTNYANWWTYYRTRMQMMKTATSNALAAIDSSADIASNRSKFRLGFMTLNNNGNKDFVNLGEFTGTQKGTWYDKLVKANPNSGTPLRQVLADAGRIYAGLLNGSNYNDVTVTEPMQFSCQKNFALLSSDGFWNGNAGYKLDGSTAVDNQDAAQNPPYGDGGTGTIQTRTSTLQSAPVTTTYTRSTNQLQSRNVSTAVAQPSTAAPPILARESSNGGSSWTDWVEVPSCTIDSNGSSRRQCQFPMSTSSNSGLTWTAWSYLAVNTTCTPDTSGSGRTACATVWTSWANVSSCTVSGSVGCQYAGWTTPVAVSSCASVPPSTGSPYTVGQAVQCTATPNPGTWSNATGPCVVTSANACRYTSPTGWANVSSCTPVPQDSSPNYTTLTARECQVTGISGGTSNTLSDVAWYYYSTDLRRTGAASPDVTGTCTGPIFPASNTTPNDLCANNVSTNGRDIATHQHMTTFTLGLGAQGKMIYAPTDGSDYWNDKSGDFFDVAKGSTATPATGICLWQASGKCVWPTPAANSNANIDDLWHAAINGRGKYFSARDASSLASSLTDLLTAIAAEPRPGTAAAAASSNPNVSTFDNFVFSSSYQSVNWFGEMVRQTIDVSTATLSPQNWSAMRLLDCATTSWTANTVYVQGDVYQNGGACYLALANYTSGSSFDGSTSGVDGQATRQLLLDEANSASGPVVAQSGRTIYTNSSTSLIPFTWTNVQSIGLDNFFSQGYLSTVVDTVTGATRMSQFCPSGASCLSSADQASASGAELINFLRGDRTRENTFYRKRVHVLGDIVSSEGRYVKAPLFNYVDAGYGDFKTAMATRQGTVYVGANDGMLHAFNADTGQEAWAYVPPAVIPNLYALADKSYASNHQYFVDATPEVGDISVPCTPVFPATSCNPWKTILVGGLNRGGKSYYALDITNPSDPKYLWTFSNSNMGYTFGNPRITKLKDGTWVVILTSGYGTADGKGYLYVLNASTGALIRTIATNTGSAGTPANIARMAAHAPTSNTDNTVRAVYSGDLLGNLWRFDVNGDLGAAGFDAQILVSYKDPSGVAQPITAKPTVVTVNGTPVVYVGTGQYLGTNDIGSTQTQSFYAAVDLGGSTTMSTPRISGSGFVQQTLTADTCPAGAPTTLCESGQIIRTVSSNPVNMPTDKGWYLDFLTGGERDFTDPSVELGTVVFTTNLPSLSSGTVCGDPGTAGAKSFSYALDYKTGGPVVGSSGIGAVSLGDGTATRPVMIMLANGTVITLIRVSTGVMVGSSTDMGTTKTGTPPIGQSSGAGLKRVSWRELTMQ